ncbi:MAG: DEAD/DEAH box helicase [Anaerolineae bacterium]|nr:DEAD/DEAH box helicase [Anaerolineae bacterium]
MSIQNALDRLWGDPGFMRNVVAWERRPARPARYADFPAALDDALAGALRALNIAPLYTHQAAAVEAALRGENVVVVTGTASGKTLCYNLPVLQACRRDPEARALYLFPTKALAQDQAAALGALVKALGGDVPVSTYDGDTPARLRSNIRKASGVILSNPDMLHQGILPHHTRWAAFFANLRYVVIDEMHTYRGVFGSHMANVLRRLRRVCRFYGSAPRFVCTSATIANPRELAETLLEAPVTVVDDDGAPQGEKHVIIYNPPVIDEALGVRVSHMREAERLAGEFLSENVQTVVFARARLTAEVMLGYLRDRVAGARGDPTAVRGYRGGYLPNERRAIEAGLRDGTVRGVVATNALELGVDIGQLNAAVIAGYPGTIASTWQQAGRAGRRTGGERGYPGVLGQRARPVHRAAPALPLRALAGARPHQPRQPGDPGQPPALRRLRAAVRARRGVRRAGGRDRPAGGDGGGGGAAHDGRYVPLDRQRVPSGRREPAHRDGAEHRDPGCHAGGAARDRPDRPGDRAAPGLRGGGVPARRGVVPDRGAGLGERAGAGAPRGGRLLHARAVRDRCGRPGGV